MKRPSRDLQLATELGVTMGLMAAGLTMLGLWLGIQVDARLGTRPIATLVLLLGGAVAGQLSLFRLAGRARRTLESDATHVLSRRDALQAARTALVLLALLIAPPLTGLLVGVWLDARIGTQAVLTLVLSVGGLGVGRSGCSGRSRGAPGLRARSRI